MYLDHMKRLQTNEPTQSLTTIMPTTVDQLLQDQEEDKYNVVTRKYEQFYHF
jgi:hypothetical protein